jgi:plasmid stabilization system protein ParE
MSRRLVQHARFRLDLLEIFNFIGQDSHDAAVRFIQAVRRDLYRLIDMPGMGATRPWKRRALREIRALPIETYHNYLLFYRYDDTTVYALRLLHGARDIDRVFGDKPV